MGATQRYLTLAAGEELRGKLRAFSRRTGLGTMEIARATGMTWPGVHYIRTGKRAHPARESCERLTTFMDNYLRSHGSDSKVERDEMGHALVETDSARRCDQPADFILTASARVVLSSLDFCARRHINGAIFGDPGVGKSEAMRYWSATTKYPHAVVFCRAYTSYTKLLRAISRVLDIDGPTTVGDLDDALHEELAARPKLLVIDEADMLNARTLDWLRTIWDESGRRSSFVLLAKPAFYHRLQVAHARSRQDLRQVWRRLAHKKMLAGITREEMLEYLGRRELAKMLEPGAGDALYDACGGSFGDLDMMVEIIRQILDENPKLAGKVTVAAVEKARQARFGADIGRRR